MIEPGQERVIEQGNQLIMLPEEAELKVIADEISENAAKALDDDGKAGTETLENHYRAILWINITPYN